MLSLPANHVNAGSTRMDTRDGNGTIYIFFFWTTEIVRWILILNHNRATLISLGLQEQTRAKLEFYSRMSLCYNITCAIIIYLCDIDISLTQSLATTVSDRFVNEINAYILDFVK
ncbi:hypothetical protein ACJX0J_040229 [Zea mays]